MAQTHSLDLESGSSQYASIADGSQTGLDLTGNNTVEAWLKLESAPATNGTYAIVRKYSETGNNRSYAYRYQDVGGTKRFEVRYSTDGTGANTSVGTLNYSLPVGVWVHVAFAYSTAGNCSVYVNGSLAGTISSLKTSIFSGAATFLVGGSTDDSDYFDGLIKDVRVFNDVRTQSEIVADAHTEHVSDANLVGEWNFNNSYADTSGNGNTLTPSGSPVFSTDIPWTAPTGVAGSPLETGLVSYYTLDEVSGTREDSHGANDLTDNNTVGSAVGKINNGADFESANAESLSITDASQSGLDFSGDMSISVWVKLKSQPPGGNYYFVSKYASSNFAYRLIYANGSGLYFSTSSNGTTNTGAFIAGNLSLDTWHHIVVSKSGTLATIFVDGKSIGSVTVTSSIFNGTAPFVLASTEDDDYDGMLDETALYSRALHYGEVLDLYNAGSGITYASGPAEYTLTAEQGSFTLSGQSAILRMGKKIVAGMGSFVLTGFDATLKFFGWENIAKSETSWSNPNKSASDWSNQNKNSSNWVNQDKS